MDIMHSIKQIMVKCELNSYSKLLFENQNLTDNPELKNLLTKKEYLNLLSSVLEIIKEHKYASAETIKEELLKRSGLKEAINAIVYEKKLTPGLNLTFGSNEFQDEILCGNTTEFILDKNAYKKSFFEKVELNTIYDLASTSKLFTSLAIYSLVDAGVIDLDKPVTHYCPQFKNLKSVTIYDLLKFKINIQTPLRVDSAKTFNDAEAILFSSFVPENQDIINAYSDMDAMILKYVVESASKMNFNEYVSETIFKPLKMDDTHLFVPEEKIHRVATNNFNMIVNQNGQIIENQNTMPATSHDPKARIMKSKINNAPGHAGYFSTSDDMMILGEALLNGKIISQQSLHNISKSETGRIKTTDVGEIYTRYYGSQTYLKQKDPNYLSVNPSLSGKAFMSPGFAGTTFLLDPLNHIVMFIGANRLHNRIYNIPERFIQTKRGLKYYQGQIISSSFAKDKEEIVEIAMHLALQYQFLDALMPKEKKKKHVREL